MQFLPILLAAQIFLAGFTLDTPSQLKQTSFLQQGARYILGVSTIAEDILPPDPTPSSDETSSDQNSPPQSSNSSDSQNSSINTAPNTSDSSNSPQNSTTDQNTSSDAQDNGLMNAANKASEDQSAQIQPQENQPKDQAQEVTSVHQPSSPDASAIESLVPLTDMPIAQASTTVLTSLEIVNGPAEETDHKAEEKAQKQDEAFSKALTPQEQTTLSIGFAKDTIKDLEQHIKSDDFATTTFEVQRLTSNIDTFLENSQKSQSVNVQNSAKTFCKQADILLKTQQLAVPEEAEQDFEIARAKCMEVIQ